MLWAGDLGTVHNRNQFFVQTADFAGGPSHRRHQTLTRAFLTDEPQPHFLSRPLFFPAEEIR